MLSYDKTKNKLKKSYIQHFNNKDFKYMPNIMDKNILKTIDNNNCYSCDFDSRPLSGKNKYKFKKNYEFALGIYEEKKKIKYKMDLIKEITAEYQRNAYLSRKKFKNKKKDFFPSIDFLIKYRMKNKDKIEEEKNKNTNNINKLTTFTIPTSFNKSKLNTKLKK